ncbi:MAG: RnfABCDGE type electron transport complex subunit D [Rectinemataceae bacterium]
MKETRIPLVGSAPFFHAASSTAGDIWTAILVLLPCLAWGTYAFGWRALAVVFCSVAAAMVGDLMQSAFRGRFELGDGSAALTGLLIGYSMTAGVPLHIPILSSLFAILVVKGAFGGLGNNWMNPALAGIVFATLNWPGSMAWIGSDPRLGAAGVPESLDSFAASIDAGLTHLFNSGFSPIFGVELADGYIGPLLGLRDGRIGETSGFLLLAASAILIGNRILRWEVPASIFAAFGTLTWIFGGMRTENSFFSGDLLKALSHGSFFLVAFFMATDPVTSPTRRSRSLWYGAGIGSIAFILGYFGTRFDAMGAAVLMMNCFVPALDGMWKRHQAGGAA